ncbi:MAG: phosphatidylglycerophosphatase A [Bacteroidetes bacterium]|nr:MAG: phosphatidylglycerophosphatase A [Bacteroidota bacterium]
MPVFYRLLATGFGSGYSPFASGTAGSLAGIVLYLPFIFIHQFFFLAVTVLFFFAGVIVSARMERAIGDDPSIVVIDEIVGMWVSLLFLPASVWVIGIAFILFRLFDIFKPSPARESEALKNGWGIMMDDIIAGLYTNLLVRLLLLFLPIG